MRLSRISQALSLALSLAGALQAAPPAWRPVLDADFSQARFLDGAGSFQLEAHIESRMAAGQVVVEFEASDDLELFDPPPPFAGSLGAGETLTYQLSGRVLPGTHGPRRVVLTIDHRVPVEALIAEVRTGPLTGSLRAAALRNLEGRVGEIETGFYPLYVSTEEVAR